LDLNGNEINSPKRTRIYLRKPKIIDFCEVRRVLTEVGIIHMVGPFFPLPLFFFSKSLKNTTTFLTLIDFVSSLGLGFRK
jgi:hypothetical protein